VTEERTKLSQLELKLVKVSASDTAIPSYAIIPISSELAQNNESCIPYVSTNNSTEHAVISDNATMDVMDHRKLDAKVTYAAAKNTTNSNETNEVALLATDIILNNFTQHAIDAFNNNDDYGEFKVFHQMAESSVQDDLPNMTDHPHKSASLPEVRSDDVKGQSQSVPINLGQKIMRDGLQDTIAHISEETHFTSDMKQYKNEPATISDSVFARRINTNSGSENAALYSANCITSHIPEIISSSHEDTHLFESEIDALSFIDDAATLPNEPLDATPNHDLCANAQSAAVELAIATEEELPSPWIDVMALATAPALRTQSWSELNAFPTAVHSLVDLVGPEPYPLEIEAHLPSMESPKNAVNIEHVAADTVEVVQCQRTADDHRSSEKHFEGDTRNKRDILYEITANADICRCIDCKCDGLQNCQNRAESPEVARKDTIKIVDEFVSSLQGGCSCNAAVSASASGGCESCCVVICLKTLQQLQKVFSNCCKNASSATASNACCGEKLLPTLMKCQLARNQ